MVESKERLMEDRVLNDIEKKMDRAWDRQLEFEGKMGKTLDKILERIAMIEANDKELKMKVDMFIESSYRNQREVKYRIEKNEEKIEKNEIKNDQNIKDLKEDFQKELADAKKDNKKTTGKLNMIIGGLNCFRGKEDKRYRRR